MLKVIIEKEIRDILGSATFGITFGVCAILILLSFYIGASSYHVAQEQYEASKAENLRQMEGLTDWLALEQHRIFLPPEPLAALVSGVANDVGRTIEVHRRGELTADDSKFSEDPIFAVSRFLDLEFMFQIVLSLFAILLGYDAISGEKERGTLRLSLANAVPRTTYIIGKLAGSFIALTISLVLAILLGCLLLPILGVPMEGGDWGRLALIIMTGLLYFGVFLAASIFVSALTHRSANSFLILLVIWILSVMIVPRVSVLLAGRAVDVPSVDELDAQKAHFSSQLWTEFHSELSSFTPPQNKDDPEAMMNAFNQYMDSLSTIRNEKINEFSARLNEDRANRQRQQEKLAFTLARFSPAASLAFATSTLAGTSLEIKNRFLEQATAYSQVFKQFMKEKTGINIGAGMIIMRSDDSDEQPEPIDPQEMPAFTYASPPLAEVLPSAVIDMGLLLVMNLLFFAGAFVAFLRYDVR